MISEKVSPFVETNKPWIITKTIADYLRAKNLFGNMDREIDSDESIPFEQLMTLSDILFTIKEDLHLIFKRLIDPKKTLFEEAEKCTPNQDEIDFSNNVGLLFHKTMVARELKYLMEHYSTDSEDYTDSRTSLNTYWTRMRLVFEDGVTLIKRLLVAYSSNVIVLSYLIENDRYVRKSLGESVSQLLKMITGDSGIDSAYIRVGVYFRESGWNERARKSLGEALKLNPKNSEARALLKTIPREKSSRI